MASLLANAADRWDHREAAGRLGLCACCRYARPMRQIGTLPHEPDARRFADFLLTCGIRTQLEPAVTGWLVWVLDEDKVADGRAEFARFVENPAAARYDEAAAEAGRLRDEAIAREKQSRRNIVDVKSQWTRPSANRPVTWLLIGVSVAVAFMTNFGSDQRPDSIVQKLSFSSFEVTHRGIAYFPLTSPLSDVRQGQIWRLVTPIFIHFGPMHLLFNMLATHSIGGVLEMRFGSLRLALLVLALAVCSNTAQYAWDGPTFGGISGVVFGLFGFAWMKSRFDPAAGIYIDPGTVTMMLIFLVLCMTGMLGRIANAAHLVGLLGGVAAGIAPVAWRRLMRG